MTGHDKVMDGKYSQVETHGWTSRKAQISSTTAVLTLVGGLKCDTVTLSSLILEKLIGVGRFQPQILQSDQQKHQPCQ